MNEITVKVYRNRLAVTFSTDGPEITALPDKPFSTDRLLVGSIRNVTNCLQAVMKHHMKRALLKPIIFMRPMEMVDGCISEAEFRTLQQVGYEAGARDVKIIDIHNQVISGDFPG